MHFSENLTEEMLNKVKMAFIALLLLITYTNICNICSPTP